jgi:hypothetical protein
MLFKVRGRKWNLESHRKGLRWRREERCLRGNFDRSRSSGPASPGARYQDRSVLWNEISSILPSPRQVETAPLAFLHTFETHPVASRRLYVDSPE